MSPSDLDELFQNQGSAPLRLTLSSGDQVIVERPDLVVFSGLSLYFGVGFTPGSRIGQRLKIVSVPNITLIEEVPNRNGGRRRRK